MKNRLASCTDNHAFKFPVSVKGVIIINEKCVLLKNERNEWELPGGKLEKGEELDACLSREIFEETGMRVISSSLLDIWLYHISEDTDVVVITYGCRVDQVRELKCSLEHKTASLFESNQIGKIRMPKEYKVSIKRWYNFLNNFNSKNL